jgi:hypothetical protein
MDSRPTHRRQEKGRRPSVREQRLPSRCAEADNQIVGGLDKRLAGRPRFPLNRLHDSAKLEAFLGVLDRIVDDTLTALAAKQGVGS